MKRRVYNIVLTALLLISQQVVAAQEVPTAPKSLEITEPMQIWVNSEHFNRKHLDAKMQKLNQQMKDLDIKMDALNKELHSKNSKMLASLEKLKELPEMDIHIKGLEMNAKAEQHYQTLEKVKRITKSYAVDRNDKLAINNQYGKVIVNVWAKNEIKVDIEIKAYESTEEKAEQLLNGVKIDESKSNNLISFKTTIERTPQGWWGIKREKNGKEERKGIWIDYVIYMPSHNALDITNKYGSIVLPDFDGPVNINNNYGSLNAKALHHAANLINVKYGSAHIENIEAGNVNVSYGSLNVSNANKINADVSYGSTKIGKISNGGSLENKYGSLKIEEVDKSIKMLTITTDKGSVNMGVDPMANFDFDVTVHMGGFRYPNDKVNITGKTPNDDRNPQFTKNYKGKYGSGSNSRVLIKSSYGSVKFQ